jgi:hypothetical protein
MEREYRQERGEIPLYNVFRLPLMEGRGIKGEGFANSIKFGV